MVVLVGLLAIGASATTDPVAPVLIAPPDGFSAAGPGSRVLRLAWERVAEASAYEVRVNLPTGEFQSFTRVVRRNHFPFGTAHPGEYSWQVRCLYADPDVECVSQVEFQSGPWSETWRFDIVRSATRTPINPNCDAILFPRHGYTLIAGNNYIFRWRPLPGAYQYEFCLDRPDAPPICGLVDSSSWEFRSAPQVGQRRPFDPREGAYHFRMRAITPEGPTEWCAVGFRLAPEGDHSPCWGMGISPAAPPELVSPEDRSVLDPTEQGFLATLSWNPIPEAVLYEVVFGTPPPPPGRQMPNSGIEVPELDMVMQGNPQRPGMQRPPTSVLTETPFYDLVIPAATRTMVFVWSVRAIVPEGEILLPTRFAPPWSFVIGDVADLPVDGSPVEMLPIGPGSEFVGPGTVIPLDWRGGSNDLFEISVFDATGTRVAFNYRRGAGWDAEVPVPGVYAVQIRKMDQDRTGRPVAVSPCSATQVIRVGTGTLAEGCRRLGDLVGDGEINAGDAIRALRHSVDPTQTRMNLRDASAADCNGDGRIDSGDAIYMLRRAVEASPF